MTIELNQTNVLAITSILVVIIGLLIACGPVRLKSVAVISFVFLVEFVKLSRTFVGILTVIGGGALFFKCITGSWFPQASSETSIVSIGLIVHLLFLTISGFAIVVGVGITGKMAVYAVRIPENKNDN